MHQKILVVDDEKDLRDLLSHHLAAQGFRVITAATGSQALDAARGQRPDLIILDVMLPDLQGTDVIKRLRADPATASIPVLFLTARGDEIDRVLGFELGADDYVVKPFSPRELVLRVRALVRRGRPTAHEVLVSGRLRLDPGRHEATLDGKALPLTLIEFRLLGYLMGRPGRVVTREQLLDNVWEKDVVVTDRTVDTHVKRLRSKLGGAAENVETVRGVGYRFRG